MFKSYAYDANENRTFTREYYEKNDAIVSGELDAKCENIVEVEVWDDRTNEVIFHYSK